MNAVARYRHAGAPAWVMTFADLMSLLMCFFVLLLSFSEMDLNKYKQIAGSMELAFGVQREIDSRIMPKGTSLVAREFSPGRPTPSAVQVLEQQTTDDAKDDLDFRDAMRAGPRKDADEAGSPADRSHVASRVVTVYVNDEPGSRQGERIRETLQAEIRGGLLEVQVQPGRTIVRIQEQGSFASGSAELFKLFRPVMRKISGLITTTRGRVVVTGYTDDVPISTSRFRSNWELSSARAVTVLHELLAHNRLDEARITVQGQADNNPLVSNDTSAGRATNRRVEIVIEEPSTRDRTGAGLPGGDATGSATDRQ